MLTKIRSNLPMILFGILIVFSLPMILFAQDNGGGISIDETFGTYAGLVAGVVLITGLIKKFLTDKQTFLVSIIVSTLVCAAGWYFKFGIFIGLEWWGALLYDIGVVFIVKGTVSIDQVISFLNLFKIGPKAPEITEKK